MNVAFPDWLLVIILTVLLVLLSLRTLRSGLRLRAAELRNEDSEDEVRGYSPLMTLVTHAKSILFSRNNGSYAGLTAVTLQLLLKRCREVRTVFRLFLFFLELAHLECLCWRHLCQCRLLLDREGS